MAATATLQLSAHPGFPHEKMKRETGDA